MTAVLPISAAPTALRTEEARPGRWRRMPTKAKVGAVLLGLFVLAGIIGPFVAPYDPSFQNPSPDLSLHAPYGAHLLGTTQSGQDVLSQMLEGIRLTLELAFFVGLVATAAPIPPEPRPYDAMLAQGWSGNGAPPAVRAVAPTPIPLVMEQAVADTEDEPLGEPPREEFSDSAEQPEQALAEHHVSQGHTSSAALSQLAASLRLVGEEEASPFALNEDSVLVTVRGELLVRTAGMIGFTGSLDFRPEFKRFRGRVTDRPFGEGADRMQRVLGTGAAWVSREGRRFLAVSLGEEGAYLREPMVFGFEEQVNFENGRVPSDVAPDLDLVHLAGMGQVLLCPPGALRSLEVRADAPVTVPLEHWVGWQGQIAPRVLAMPWDHPRGGAALAVELTGEGFALLCVGMG